jgi:hypothetical protein
MSRDQRLKSEHTAAVRSAVDAFVHKPCRLSAEQAEGLLDTLCVKLGYCLTPDDYDAIVANPPTDPQAFAELVMTLDGGGPGDDEMFEAVLDLVFPTFERVARAQAPD